YTREIFLQQPNRIFVRTLIVTEKHIRLIQFDRAGALYSPLINYHANPDILIRLIAGLSSTTEEELGLDTSVWWETIDGRKAPGYIMVYHPVTKERTFYRMRSADPFLARDDLCERGTRMWDVKDDEGAQLLVKDAWIEEWKTPEYVHLSKVVGVEGVQQLVIYEDGTSHGMYGEIKNFRPECTSPKQWFQNKSFQRVVTVRYGEPMDSYKSKTEAEIIAAFHDAIAAHERLLDSGILHCDISLGNILFGGENAPEGLRGILIDLDYAVRHQYYTSPTPDFTAGTRYCQSQLLLRSHGICGRPGHDYLDDLESFFWALIHLVYRVPHNNCAAANKLMEDWRSDDMQVSGGMKKAFLDECLKVDHIPGVWSRNFARMVVELHRFIGDVVREKEAIMGDLTCWSFANMRRLQSMKNLHYYFVLSIFKDALPTPPEHWRHMVPTSRQSM
ncbi:hypothetical protein DFP72DRAFT_797956, partial [Ephemerocybe angulata]